VLLHLIHCISVSQRDADDDNVHAGVLPAALLAGWSPEGFTRREQIFRSGKALFPQFQVIVQKPTLYHISGHLSNILY